MHRPSTILVAVTLATATALSAQEPDLVIGGTGARPEQAFGRIADVVVDASGNTFVLDAQTVDVRWFGPDGRWRGSAGGAGSGPGQLRGPQHLASSRTGEVLVLDPLNRRIATYRTGDTGLEHVSDVPSMPAIDFCAMGDALYLVRIATDSVVTILDRNGRITGAWGALILPEPGHNLPPDEMRLEMDNQARILCDAGTETVTLLYERLPVVRRYDRRGELLWEAGIEDYHQVQDVRTPDESEWMIAPDPATGTAHSGRAITTGPEGTLIVTLYEGSAEGGRFDARVLNAADGSELRRAESPMIIVSATVSGTIGYVNAPVPSVLRYAASAITGAR